jgi:outer membrane protein TolC
MSADAEVLYRPGGRLLGHLRLRTLPGLLSLGLCALTGPLPLFAQSAAPAPPPTTAVTVAAPKPLPISLDAVLHLAGEQNGQLNLARQKVCEAYASKELAAATAWLPDLYAGPAYYRHEGGIQNEDGTLTHSSTGAVFGGLEFYGRIDLREAVFRKVQAERQVWQQKGEVSQLTHETLLDAASTYLDWLLALSAEATAREQENSLRPLLQKAEELEKKGEGTHFLVESLRAGMVGLEQNIVKLRQQQHAAASKLTYLLGLGPCVDLVPMEGKLAPVDLADATPPACELINRALAAGPGVRELEGLLASIQRGMEQSKGMSRFLPVLEVRMAEGAFGAGPGAGLSFDNRWDLGLNARWNLSAAFSARERLQVAESKMYQVHLTLQDLRAKLSAGVEEARQASLSGQEQIRLASEQVRHAEDSYQTSKVRHEESLTTPAEVMQAIQALGAAQLNYLGVVNAYDKAQLRLLLLLGPKECAPAAPVVPPPPVVTPASYTAPEKPRPLPPAPVVPAVPAVKPRQTSPPGQSGLDALRSAQKQYGNP